MFDDLVRMLTTVVAVVVVVVDWLESYHPLIEKYMHVLVQDYSVHGRVVVASGWLTLSMARLDWLCGLFSSYLGHSLKILAQFLTIKSTVSLFRLQT